MKRVLTCLLAWMFVAALSLPAGAQPQRIGVLANRGPEECLARWNPTARVLSRMLGEDFLIVPLGFQEITPAVHDNRIDYIVVNSGQYVALEKDFGVQRLATLKNRVLGQAEAVFGSVIFTRANRTDIASLIDLHGKRIMAVEPSSFGGWLAAARELKAAGLVEGRHFKIEFGGSQDAPLHAVIAGRADVGVIRTDLLETMAEEGRLDLKDLKVLPPPPLQGSQDAKFPLLRSTRLYPEWPFAKLRQTPSADAERVLIALLSIQSESEAAKAGHYAGWTVPLNYQSVHECLIELRYGPYADYGKVRLTDVLRAYWPWFLLSLTLLATATATAIRLRTLNRALKKALAEVQALSGLLRICAWCKRIRNEKDEWTDIETYLNSHSHTEFTHGICPDCSKRFKT